MDNSVIQKLYDYYVSHEQELLEKYNGKHLVISDGMNVIPFSEEKEAYRYGAKEFGGGHFLLQECKPGILNVVHQINCYV